MALYVSDSNAGGNLKTHIRAGSRRGAAGEDLRGGSDSRPAHYWENKNIIPDTRRKGT